jgi:tRNA-binding EMAP/Myf-like protein
MSERKLAHVEVIEKIEPIPGADKIEKLTVLGWEVVAQKGKFNVGDKCIYIEIDSILPPRPEFHFLEPRRYRIKTIKLKRQISQGIVFKFEEVGLTDVYKVGHDLTEYLGITKYDPQAKEESLLIDNKPKNPIHKFLLRFKWYRFIQPKKTGSWPKWIQKTDEERIQNLPSIFEKYPDTKIYWTEKIDGKSISISYKKTKVYGLIPKWIFTVCSRNMWLKTKTDRDYWRIVENLDLSNKLKKYKREILIQGELCGPKIQKNKYNFKDLELYVFNVYDIKNDTWFGIDKIRMLCDDLNLKMVPILGIGTLKEVFPDVKSCVERAKGTSIFANRQREGIVVRQYDDSKGKRGISFKSINPEFLLGLEEDE